MMRRCELCKSAVELRPEAAEPIECNEERDWAKFALNDALHAENLARL
jgi:hypothetical protein